MRNHKKALLVAGMGIILFAIIATARTLYTTASTTARPQSAAVNSLPESLKEMLSEVPPGAPTLVYIDLAAMRDSAFYRHRPDHGPVPDRDYTNFVQDTGFDFEKDLDRAVVASWPQSSPADKKAQYPQKIIAVADGRFDRKKIHDYAVKNGKIEQQQGHEVFLFRASNSTGNSTNNSNGWNSLVFLNDHRVALVAGPSIAPVLAAHSADFSEDPVRERAAGVAGAAAFMISHVPAMPDNPPGKNPAQTAQWTALVRSVQWFTLAARPEGEDLRVSLEGECQTEADAHRLQSSLEVLRMIGRASLQSPKARQSMDSASFNLLDILLQKAEVGGSGKNVRILLEITPDIWKWIDSQKGRLP